jgi:hypothetical protein
LRLLTIVDTDIQYKDAKSELRPVTKNQHSTHISISLTAALHTWMDHLSRAPKTSTQSHSVSRTCALLPAAAGFTWSLVITYSTRGRELGCHGLMGWLHYTDNAGGFGGRVRHRHRQVEVGYRIRRRRHGTDGKEGRSMRQISTAVCRGRSVRARCRTCSSASRLGHLTLSVSAREVWLPWRNNTDTHSRQTN